MRKERRSGCPISFSLDLFGDRWSLLILRDLVFGGRVYYSDFLEAGEGISTNVLADRLVRLERAGLIDRDRDPRDRKRYRYRLTAKGMDTIPVLLELIVWGGTHDPDTAAPGEFIERVRTDREAMLEEIRSRLERGSG